jgi:hypothetical protein
VAVLFVGLALANQRFVGASSQFLHRNNESNLY